MVALLSVFAVVTSLAAFAVPLSALEKRTVIQIETDLNTLNTDVSTLSDAINAFQTTGGTLSTFMPIAMNALSVAISLNQAVIDTASTPGPVNTADGLSILTTVQNIQPVVISVLSNIVTKKPSFEGLLPGSLGGSAVDGLAVSALKLVSNLFVTLSDGLIAISPVTLQPTGSSIKSAIANAFNSTITAYSA